MADQAKLNEVTLIENETKSIEKINELVGSKGTFIVNVGSLQCGPCNSFAPKFKEVAKDRSEPFIALKLPTFDEAGNVVAKLNEAFKVDITSYPTTLVIKDGQVVGAPIAGNISAPLFDVVLSAKLDDPKAIDAKAVEEKITAMDANKDGVVDTNEIKKAFPQDAQQTEFARLLAKTIVVATKDNAGQLSPSEVDKTINEFVKDRLTVKQRDAITPSSEGFVTDVTLRNGVSSEALGTMASALLPVNVTKTAKVGSR